MVEWRDERQQASGKGPNGEGASGEREKQLAGGWLVQQ
jgi:hypothetical protein